MSARRAVVVVGLGDDGCVGLSSRAANAIARAQVLVGGERHLAFFPQFVGRRVTLRNGLEAALSEVASLAQEHDVVVLASGDPLFFGIGQRLVAAVGAEHVEFVPAPSSVQWAFARAGMCWDNAEFVSVHGRELVGLVTRLRRVSKAAVLTDAENSPPRIAQRLLEFGERAWEAWLCERLCGPGERVRKMTLSELAETTDCDPLNVLLLRRTETNWRPPTTLENHHEDDFAKRTPKSGLITKREVRLLSLAAMCLRPDSVVWDVGAGSGSVSIDAALLSPRGRVYAVEIDPEGVALCHQNIRDHGTDNVIVVPGRAPEALVALEPPDAVFVGGSKGDMKAIIAQAMRSLRAGGRIVVNAITLENVGETYASFREHGVVPEVTLVQIARGVSLAHYQRYEAQNPIHIFAAGVGREANEVTT